MRPKNRRFSIHFIEKTPLRRGSNPSSTRNFSFSCLFFFFALACFVTGDKRVRVPMLVYGGHVMTTLLPILSEFFFRAEDYGLSQQNLMWLFSVYLPYLIIPCALTLKVALYFDEPFLVHQSSKGAKLK
eukprot:Rmarinus@m.30170